MSGASHIADNAGWMSAPEHPNESARVEELQALRLVDLAEEEVDQFTKLAASMFHVPIAHIGVPENDKNWIKAGVGIDVESVDRAVSFCGHAIHSDDMLVVPDTLEDKRFAHHPMVTGSPHIRFYAGAVFRGRNNEPLGTVCAIDRHPRTFSEENRVLLRHVRDRVQDKVLSFNDNRLRHEQVRRLADRLRTTLESITDAFYTLDPNWRFTFVNGEAERLMRCDRADLIGREIWEVFPEILGTRIEREFRNALDTGVSVALEDYRHRAGKWFDIRAYPSEEGLAVYARDITEHRALVSQLRRRENELGRSQQDLKAALDTQIALINALPAHICLLDEQGTILEVNGQWRRFGLENGYAGADLGIGRNYLAECNRTSGDCAADARTVANGLRTILAGQRDTFAWEYPCHSPDQARWFRFMASRLTNRDSAYTGNRAVVMHVDITERKLGERELKRTAYEDTLTGTYSRAGFASVLAQWLDKSASHPASLVVVLDIVSLRDINEAYSYDTGDELLGQIGRRLKAAVGENALVARIGGDEFALFVPVWRGAGPRACRGAIARVFEASFALQSLSLNISARFGYTRVGRHHRTPAEYVRQAELAMFQTRAQAGDLWRQYTRVLDDTTRHRIQRTRELQDGLERDEFELHFQPKVDLASGGVLSCEALIRWDHPEHGLLLPGQFMPVAEQSQLIRPIGSWVLHNACQSVRTWRKIGLEVVRVSVNVSMVQLVPGDFPDHIKHILETEGIAPNDLTLEITESAFEGASEVLRTQLKELHDMGVRLSLDDFGTGYSSLLYLQRYPFDEIKIDQGFVRQMLTDPYSREIVKTVIGIAAAIGSEVVAEGVERPAERDALLAMGCQVGQGFYYSMPLVNEDFRWLLGNGAKLPLSDSR